MYKVLSQTTHLFIIAKKMGEWTETAFRFLVQMSPKDIHENLLPLSFSDYLGFFFATLGLLVAAGGGVGGGGILIPIYILILHFSPKEAIALSSVTIFGGAVANMLVNSQKRHPFADRPLVDWDLVLMMEPSTIAGALIGTFINKLLDEHILVAMLVLLLSVTAYETLDKSCKLFESETRTMKASESSNMLVSRNNNESQLDTEKLELLPLMNGKQTSYSKDHDAEHLPTNDELVKLLEDEKKAPIVNIILLIVIFVVVLMVNIAKGGGDFKSPLGITCGSVSFWILNTFMLMWIIVISLQGRNYLIRRFELKQRLSYRYVEGDIQWDERSTLTYPLICTVAGLFAGMFGIGGGIVKGPLMLMMGVHPAVASATSACMILFTSTTASTSYLVFGLMPIDYCLLCLTIGFLATLVGQLALVFLMKQFNRSSFIAFSIGFVVLLSAILMTLQSVISLMRGNRHFSGGICGKDYTL
jgi:uncharacterized membrane protein YfcA